MLLWRVFGTGSLEEIGRLLGAGKLGTEADIPEPDSRRPPVKDCAPDAIIPDLETDI